MQKYRYYLPPRSKLPFAAGILAGLMTLNTIYTLISMPYYTHYWDYWATMVSGILLCGFCFLFRNRHAELTLIPAAMLALIACITPNLIHWMEVGLFFLLLLEWLVRMPRWTGKLFRVLGVLFTLVGGIAILSPMAERISSLAERISQADLCLAGHFNKENGKANRTIPGKAYIYEAMKKPMILGDNAATRERYTDGMPGITFVEMGSPEALRDGILQCMKESGYTE